MKKINHIMTKILFIYAKKNLVLTMMIKNTLTPEIIAITLKHLEALLITFVIYKTPKEIPVVFHNVSKYDYYFIIKELAEEFEGQFECLEENTKKIHNFFSTNK